VLDDNDRAIRLYEKAGFRQEGTLEDAVYKNGEYCALRVMAVLKKHYKRIEDKM
jgi:RimJ/RimL family protein N-acetyltransferase